MEQQSACVDLTIISAADLKRKWLSGDQTAVVAWVDPSAKKTTGLVSSNGSTVQWHEKLILSLNGVDNSLQGKLLTIEIHAKAPWGDSLLGSVYVPLVELAMDGEKRGNSILMYEIAQPSGKRQGSMKFCAKILQPSVSAFAHSNASGIPASPTLPLEDDPNGWGPGALYPPPSTISALETSDESRPSEANSPCPYPPQPYPPQNYTPRHDSWQHNTSYGPPGSYPPHMYPPVDSTHASHTVLAPCSPPHSNYTGRITYPPLGSETPYPPPSFVYPPSTLSSEAPYPPVAPHVQFPQTTPPHPSEKYLSASFYPYSNYSSPLYPPSYAEQPATVYYH